MPLLEGGAVSEQGLPPLQRRDAPLGLGRPVRPAGGLAFLPGYSTTKGFRWFPGPGSRSCLSGGQRSVGRSTVHLVSKSQSTFVWYLVTFFVGSASKTCVGCK